MELDDVGYPVIDICHDVVSNHLKIRRGTNRHSMSLILTALRNTPSLKAAILVNYVLPTEEPPSERASLVDLRIALRESTSFIGQPFSPPTTCSKFDHTLWAPHAAGFTELTLTKKVRTDWESIQTIANSPSGPIIAD
jgi:hypothetical protein